jgi:DNA-binding MarR family transcriptional regulator
MESTTKYCTIIFEVKKSLGISINEYIFLDIIYHLSKSKGYCYASKEYLANQLDLTRQAIHKIINRMIEVGYLARRPDKDLNKFFFVSAIFLKSTSS